MRPTSAFSKTPGFAAALACATLLVTPFSRAQSPAALALDRSFADSCERAFDKQQDLAAHGMGKKVCHCTIGERRYQGVSDESFARETEKIRRDPTYQIHDPKLLHAFQYCTIDVMEEMSHEMDAEAEGNKGAAGAESHGG